MSHSKNEAALETAGMGCLLAASGGFMDAYSYMARGHVFANAQTGNILLLGIEVSRRNWMTAAGYALPIIAFVAGVLIVDSVRLGGGRIPRCAYWRPRMLLVEMALFFSVACIPGRYDFLANALTSMACGIQVESFRTICGNAITTTMCVGNLRSGAEHMAAFWMTGEQSQMKKGALYFLVIFSFCVGAVIGNECVRYTGRRAIIGSIGILSIVCMIQAYRIFRQRSRQDTQENANHKNHEKSRKA